MKRVPATKVRQNFSQMLKDVHFDKERIIITRRGVPIAALIGIKDFRERFLEKEEKPD